MQAPTQFQKVGRHRRQVANGLSVASNNFCVSLQNDQKTLDEPNDETQ